MSLRTAVILPLVAPLAVLAACDRSEPEAVDTRAQPILQGSVSDAMIQTDQMQVEAPIEAPEATGLPEEEDTRPKQRRRPTSNSPEPGEGGGAGGEPRPAAPAAAPALPASPAPKAAATPGPRETP